MSNKPVIYLHIGLNKTGTSSLQLWLSKNRAFLLEKYGILYPDTGMIRNAHYGLSNTLGFAYPKIPQDLKAIKQLKKQFLDEICLKKPLYVIISSDYFLNNDNEVISVWDFFKDFQCNVIIYLRRHDIWFDSTYKQFISNYYSPLSRWGIYYYYKYFKSLGNHTNYDKLLDKWGDVFGKKNLIIRSYKDGLNTIADFASIFKLIGFGLPDTTIQVNESMSRDAYYYIYQIKNDISLSKKEYDELVNFFRENDSNYPVMSFLSPYQQQALINEYSYQYQYISEKYLHGEHLFEDLSVSKEKESWFPFIEPSPDKVEKKIKDLKAQWRSH